jgi:hypothetical protein
MHFIATLQNLSWKIITENSLPLGINSEEGHEDILILSVHMATVTVPVHLQGALP